MRSSSRPIRRPAGRPPSSASICPRSRSTRSRRRRPLPRTADRSARALSEPTPMSDLFSQPFEDDRQTPAPAERRVVTVSQLTAKIRGLLESGFGDVWVEGEISNCKVWNTGHMYFTLKDGGAQIKAVMYRSAVRYLKFK